jgi:hypothetical protein
MNATVSRILQQIFFMLFREVAVPHVNRFFTWLAVRIAALLLGPGRDARAGALAYSKTLGRGQRRAKQG